MESTRVNMENGTATGLKAAVVIPALNEEDGLIACLEAVFTGTLQPACVVVADGGSTDGTAAIARGLGATLVENPGRTAAAGRNVGIAAVPDVDVVAFLDADCVPVSGWLEALVGRFAADSDVQGVAGRVAPRDARNLYEEYWNHLAWEVLMQFGDEPFVLAERSILHSVVTASCAWRRSALERLGGFSEWFGNNAEDVDLTWRALDAGLKLVYEPGACVAASGVLDLAGIRRKSFRNGVSSSKLQKRYGGVLNYDPNIYRLLRRALAGPYDGPAAYRALDVNELVWHLLGKYAGSLRHGVVNV